MSFSFLWSLLLPLLCSDAHAQGESEAAPGEIEVLEDIPYREEVSDEYADTRCRFDLYLPAKAKKGFATLVWFHGGGIKDGDKQTDIARKVSRYFASEGVAVASVNYRLSPKVSYPTYLEDAAAAVKAVIERIEDHGGDSERVYISGHSAGGYIAAMVVVHPSIGKSVGLDADAIAGAMPVAGQMITHSTVREERGIPRSRPIIDEAAPSYHVRKELPPFLNFAGDKDMAMRSEENNYFIAALRATGHAEAEFMEVPERDHGTVASKIGDDGDPVGPAMLELMSR